VAKISLTYKTGLPIVQPCRSNVLSKKRVLEISDLIALKHNNAATMTYDKIIYRLIIHREK